MKFINFYNKLIYYNYIYINNHITVYKLILRTKQRDFSNITHIHINFKFQRQNQTILFNKY